jgi:DNA-binding protein H-NS
LPPRAALYRIVGIEFEFASIINAICGFFSLLTEHRLFATRQLDFILTETAVKDLERMTVKDLLVLEAEVQAAIAERRLSEKVEVKEKLQALAEKSGYSVEELFGKGKRGGTRGTVAPKYRNPANGAETWTGRGRMPVWMKTLVDKGAKREKFLIK